ncbi:uncharacterized protein LOC126847616 [Adelges cooleyi]|uniref:uncharacterized protein LOC126847615 n=1 Tax=Adelges cooleyi TaxID=133065 RepID=UPI0021808D99|nr:uncharacterized protein LOC126847615 [Adelges cooleyi]XP_050443879.1 uncharacterized protein LOC126847616 [Adelges cooleyi]
MDFQEIDLFAPTPSTSTVQPPTKPTKQATLKKRPNSKLGFSSGQKHPPPTKRTKPLTDGQVIELDDSADEEHNKLWKNMQSTTLLNLPVKTIVDLGEFTNFSGFMEVLLEDDVPQQMLMPSIAVVIMMAVLVEKNPRPGMPKAELLSTLLNFQTWKTPTTTFMTTLKKKFYEIPICRIPQPDQSTTADQGNLFDTYLILAAQIYWKTTTDCLENTPLSSVTDIWAAISHTSRTYVSLRDARNLLAFMLSLQWDSDVANKVPVTNSASCRNTGTTCTSSTPVLTQTQLVAVPGSVVAPSGGQDDEIDIDDEFSSLTSKLSTGKISLDISLQKDTQSKTAKAHVMMEDFVYELKIYKKEEIRNLDRSQWYTRVHVKGVGTTKANHPTKRKLDGLVGDLMADLKTKSNLRMEKTFCYGQKH